MTSIDLGDFRISLVREAFYWWDGGAFFGVVPKTMWAKRAPCDEFSRIRAGFNSYLIETGDRNILIETGQGDKPDERARERMNLSADAPRIHETLAARGFEPESIDIVINTHLHWDHCGGNTVMTDAGPRPAFPHAVYYAPAGEWEHAHERHPRDSVSYIDANYDPLIDSGRMCLVTGERQIVPGVRMVPVRGHNRDMNIVIVESGARTFCFLSDLAPLAAHVNPTWVAAFDLYPLDSIDNKFHWLGKAALEGWTCGFGHDPEIAFARVQPYKGRFETTGEVG